MIEEFLTGAKHAGEVNRALATVMFTDIVDSIRRPRSLGIDGVSRASSRTTR